MLIQAIGELLPYSVGVALSPVPIVAVILMLTTPKGRANGLAFALGWVVGLSAAATIVLVVTGGSDQSGSATADSVNWAQLAIGVLFLAMAGRQWRKRPRDGEAPELPGWMATVDHVGPGKALGLGILLSGLNPKNLALAAAAGAALAQAGLDVGGDVVGVAVFVVLGSVTVAGLALFAAIAPRAAAAPLSSIKTFMSTHNAVIMMVILLVFGAKLVGEGVGVIG